MRNDEHHKVSSPLYGNDAHRKKRSFYWKKWEGAVCVW